MWRVACAYDVSTDENKVIPANTSLFAWTLIPLQGLPRHGCLVRLPRGGSECPYPLPVYLP